MKPPLLLQTPKPSSNRSKSKEAPNSKRSEISSTESKILCKSSTSNLPDSSEKEKQQKIVAKSLDPEFEAVSEEISPSPLDLEIFTSDQEQMSSLSLQSTISSEIVEERHESGKIVVLRYDREASVAIDLMKDSILEVRNLAKGCDSLVADLGHEGRAGRWSDPVFWSKLQIGLTLFLILMVGVLNVLATSKVWINSEEESTFSGLYPT